MPSIKLTPDEANRKKLRQKLYWAKVRTKHKSSKSQDKASRELTYLLNQPTPNRLVVPSR